MARHHVILSHYPGYDPYDGERQQLAACNADLTVAKDGPEAVADDVVALCDVVLNLGWRISAVTLDRMPRCGLITVYGIGTDSVDVEAATERGIIVSNIPFAAVDDVANHATALMLAWLRRLFQADAGVRRGDYEWDVVRPCHNPRGKTLGLVAFGNTARAVADKMSSAFGMNVIAHDPYVPPEAARKHGARLTTLEEVFRESDLISVHVPRTPESLGMIGEAYFRSMKPTAFLVAVGRGGVIEEGALIRALREGWIAGAALDVQAHEPVPPDDPLLDAPNLILTPHSAGYSEESEADLRRLALDAACRILEGRWPRWVVNRDVVPRVTLTGGTEE